jgi:hypothetical protein
MLGVSAAAGNIEDDPLSYTQDHITPQAKKQE